MQTHCRIAIVFLLTFLPSATKLQRLCFYTCLSVILFTGGVCYPSMHCRWYPSMPCSRGVCSWGGGGCLLQGDACSRGQVCSWGVPTLGGGLLLGGGVMPAPGRVPAPGGCGDPPRNQTATVGTHPTEMHSCCTERSYPRILFV